MGGESIGFTACGRPFYYLTCREPGDDPTCATCLRILQRERAEDAEVYERSAR